MKKKEISRRHLLKGLMAAAGGLGLRQLAKGLDLEAMAQTMDKFVYLPIIIKNPGPGSAPGNGRVVHVHDPSATNWNGSGWYGNAVNQGVVDTMVEDGLKALTGQTNWASIWNTLFTRVRAGGYQPGQGIAIKVNLNNSDDGCGSHSDTQIDALPQPVLAIIKGLTQASVREEDIWVYDVKRQIYDRFRNPIASAYPGVKFYGEGACTNVIEATFGKHSSLTVQFPDPDGNLSDRQLADVLYDATYLINMPILKKHGIAPVSLGFKNHFGSLDSIIKGGDDNLHRYIEIDHTLYDPDYNPKVSIYLNPNIKDKIILTVGDGLYGAAGATQPAKNSWSTFDDDAPNSFFFAADPVAIDCVMCDILRAEWPSSITNATYDYLFIAENAGLGICEGTRSAPGGDPWQLPYGSGYEKITYVRL